MEAYVTGMGDDVSALEAWSSRCVITCLLGAWIDCYCFTRHVQHLPLCEILFKSPLQGPIIPFGAEVKFYPISAKEQGRVCQFGPSDSHINKIK